jgi:hypothetical protein
MSGWGDTNLCTEFFMILSDLDGHDLMVFRRLLWIFQLKFAKKGKTLEDFGRLIDQLFEKGRRKPIEYDPIFDSWGGRDADEQSEDQRPTQTEEKP